MNGVLLVDKPQGLTSHDVVASLRRSSAERRVGHTGTLDPMATGLLPLVFGRATRLASLLTQGDKTYKAVIRLGTATDTDDALGTPTGPPAAELPDPDAIRAALARFRGTFQQVPPPHSAKRVGGRRAYALARQAQPVALAPVAVTVRDLECLACRGADVEVRLSVSPGFYVRALARDLGGVLGCGAHLAALRRTASGAFDLTRALTLDAALGLGPALADHLLAPEAALPDLPSVVVTEHGLRRTLNGAFLTPEDLDGLPPRPPAEGASNRRVKVLAPDGRLVALAEARGGALHPVVVLG